MKKTALTVSLLCATSVSAQVHKVDVKKELPKTGVVDLYHTANGKKKVPLTSLSQLKDYEIHLKWNECVSLAPQVFANQKPLRGWVALTWFHCLEQAQLKKKDASAEAKLLATMAKNQELLFEGPWSTSLHEAWLSVQLAHLEEQVLKKNTKVAEELETLLNGKHVLSKEQKSKIYQLLGDISLQKVNYAEAQFLYEEAQDQRNSAYLQDKLDFLAKTRGETESVKQPASTLTEMGEEIKIEERLRQSLKQGDDVSALKDTMEILNKYPGSRSAKRLKDKPLEIYNALSEKLAKVKALNEMEEADPSRLLDWAQSLHRRGDFAGALSLAQKATNKNSQSPQTTNALWIAGRSAHFLGQYDRALDIYNNLVTYHNGSDEAAEALFRSALIYYRKKDFSTASAMLERLLQQNRDRYDLNSQYWLVRSLQESNPERAKQAAAALIEKYPFSYYGLRLSAEAAGGKLTWPEIKDKAPKLQNDIYLVGAQKKSWQRFKSLSTAGWVSEAQAELSGLPFIKDATVKVSLAEALALRQQYMMAIRLINEAMEAEPRLRREQFIKIGYPEIFTSLYQAEAERYGIDVVLLRSLTRQESAFNLRAVSTSNALGLMQMIPPTAQEVAKKLGMKVEIPDDMFRPEINIPMGSFYVSQMLDQFQGNVPFALAAYNAGPYRLKTWLEGRAEVSELVGQASGSPRDELWFDELPWTETSFYVKAILRNVLLYRLAEEGTISLKPVLWVDLLNKKAK
ncbi:transglycosylase SLT domain-containing protein [Bdellovibrio sp. 22V]|uniref:transglycosylase SLT domain-containing protein n=1 Tax=Bdellovibrio sp. 22V TaxID=3044166 RepID=UPI002543D1D5|nr:transglycosylase SLT domain-containing protein [Bdellovibrio sp. 22V]WII73632.1 transglycosylase SLT domain-containing protein [Bdellovibrio sp. 22V]